METLLAARRFYAELMTAKAGADDPRLRAAFESVPRETFLGPGPWKVHVPEGYIATPSADAALVYQDIVVCLAADRHINNGEPSLHARCLAAVAPQPGERVLHVGCGSGYYTAILSELVGAEGHVEALDVEGDLARTAKRNLQDRANVSVHHRSGVEPPLPESDVIYVNASASRPPEAWLDALAPAGRLIFPFTPRLGWGAMLLVRRRGDHYDAEFVMRAAFVPCVGGQNKDDDARLSDAFDRGDWQAVRSLRRFPGHSPLHSFLRDGSAPDETCWFAGEGWWLSTAPG